MTETSVVSLEDRGIVAITGADAVKLLDGVVTNDMERLTGDGALHAGLLTPQGKILFEFFMVRHGDGVLIDILGQSVAEFVKRMTLYRLRAKVEIVDRSAELCAAALWNADGAGSAPLDLPGGVIAYRDPRSPHLGYRLILPKQRLEEIPGRRLPTTAYVARRVAAGVAEAPADFALGDTFPHEANFDLSGSVDFKKGCFVGQEVVSRMQHKTVVRKRVVPVSAPPGALATGGELRLGEVAVGQIGSRNGEGSQALALVKLDRIADAADKGQSLTTADGTPVAVDADTLSRYRQQVATKKAAGGPL